MDLLFILWNEANSVYIADHVNEACPAPGYIGKQLAGLALTLEHSQGCSRKALFDRPLLLLLLFPSLCMRCTGGSGQELGTLDPLEEESRASEWSSDVWFPGASAGMPGCFGRHAVFALPSVRSSVSFCFLGIMAVQKRWTHRGASSDTRISSFSAFSQPCECFLVILIYNIWKIAPKRRK